MEYCKKISIFMLFIFLVVFTGCNFDPGQVASDNAVEEVGDGENSSTGIKEYDYSNTKEYLDNYKEFFVEAVSDIDENGWTKQVISYICSEAEIYFENIENIDSKIIPQDFKDFHDSYLEHFSNIGRMESYFLENDSKTGASIFSVAIDNIKYAYHSIGEELQIGEITIVAEDDPAGSTGTDTESTQEEAAEKEAEEESEEETVEEPPQEEEETKPVGPSKSTYFANVRNIINEYDMLINHWNTYYQNYTDINSLIAFAEDVLNKLGQINNSLKSITPASGLEGAHQHFIDLADMMYHYQQQEMEYIKNRNIDGCNQMINNFNNTYSQFIDYYNSL